MVTHNIHWKMLWAIGVMVGVMAQNNDLFNYNNQDITESSGVTSRGQANWGQVRCDNADICTGFPNKFPAVALNYSFYQWAIDDMGNNCKWCPEDSALRNCGVHRQSPINMLREVGVDTGPNHKECKDWHWMQYRDDTCTFDDMKSQFEINRHALQIWIPVKDNGKIDCWEQGKGRRYPRLDYSKGFPDWWYLQRTDISVPSQHTQEGHRYAAEVTLAHFYEIPHAKNELGYVTIFMQDYPDEPSWPFLDKLICQWREKEESVRAMWNLTTAPPYGRCRIFTERGQTPTDEWLEEAGLGGPPSGAPTSTPSSQPSKTPSSSPSSVPSRFPTYQPSAGPSPPPVSFGQDGNEPGTSAPSDVPSTIPTLSPASSPSRFRPWGESTAPSASPTTYPTVSPSAAPSTPKPSSSPTFKPTTAAPSNEPTPGPTASPVSFTADGVVNGVPPPINCDSYSVPGSYNRMCFSSDPCCEETRSQSNYCWNIYDNVFPETSIDSACYHCCPGKTIGPKHDPHPTYEKSIQCSQYNVQRFCKPNSCCDEGPESSGFCQNQFATLQIREQVEICHYCCSESIDLGLDDRLLQIETTSSQGHAAKVGEPEDNDTCDGALMYAEGRTFCIEQADLEPAEGDPEEYFYQIYDDYEHRRRLSQHVIHEEDYEDVHYWPYEWMLKVGTEYYFRYEGTQLVPPCREFVHWRVMKDPMRVHPRQIAELNRLMAWRVDPNTGTPETAGILSPDGNSVDVSRDLQYHHDGHRDTFCECKDWPSKFQGDKDWCAGWAQDVNFDRFYLDPYSFPNNGEWLPPPV